MIHIDGVIENIIFHNADNSYTVAVLKTEDGSITIVGSIPFANIGMIVSAEGEIVYHDTYGEQFLIEKLNLDVKSDAATMKIFLTSGAVEGVGPAIANRIIDKFGDDTLEIFKNSPERLKEVSGIGEMTYEKIMNSFNSQSEYRDVLIKISGFGISINMAQKLYEAYGDGIIAILETNPYDVLQNVNGIGFKTIDGIALGAGFKEEDNHRLEAALAYVLSLSMNEGHTYLPKGELLKRTGSLLGVPVEKLDEHFDLLANNKNVQVIVENGEPICYNVSLHTAEKYVARRILEFTELKGQMEILNIEERIKRVEERDGLSFGEEQKSAIYEVFNNGALIITGGPGTGKTTTLNAIIQIGEDLGYKIELVAPTGRAANRMTEATGRSAQTIHRLLEYQFNGHSMEFARDEDNPIDTDILIVDEMSMVDIQLFFNLLRAVKLGTRIVMVGDVDQLPSVGPGNVLRDLIKSEVIKVVTLDTIFRQAEVSMIITNAHKINKGDLPILNDNGSDFFMIKSPNQMDTTKLIVDLAANRLPKYYDIDSLRDIQILTPMRKGQVGVNSLNVVLQKQLNNSNGASEEILHRDNIFRLGDKVMQIKNNYQIEWTVYKGFTPMEVGAGVYNGDIGFVCEINGDSGLKVDFDGKIVTYEREQLDELTLAYATTIHKSQGSEFPVIIMPVHFAPPMLLTRNLLYTGITRAKRLVVLVGEERYLQMMIRNNYIADRYSRLDREILSFKDFFGE